MAGAGAIALSILFLQAGGAAGSEPEAGGEVAVITDQVAPPPNESDSGSNAPPDPAAPPVTEPDPTPVPLSPDPQPPPEPEEPLTTPPAEPSPAPSAPPAPVPSEAPVVTPPPLAPPAVPPAAPEPSADPQVAPPPPDTPAPSGGAPNSVEPPRDSDPALPAEDDETAMGGVTSATPPFPTAETWTDDHRASEPVVIPGAASTPQKSPAAGTQAAGSASPTPAAAAEATDRPAADSAGAPVSELLLDVHAEGGGLDLSDSAEVISASAIALTAPRLPATVTVAVEFGKAGHGWAGAIIFNLWLRRQLRERRMSQRQLAFLSGVNHSTISRLLTGDRTPSLETAAKLARALRVSSADIGTDLGFGPARHTLPMQRVEEALRGDDRLEDSDVRAIMATYTARRARGRLRSIDGMVPPPDGPSPGAAAQAHAPDGTGPRAGTTGRQ